jgi:hypothetical protein
MIDAAPSAFVDPQPLLGDFRSDLYFPHYRAVTSGPWRIRIVAMAAARGYWGDVYRLNGAVIMVRDNGAAAESWMSMLPSEIESQEIGLRAAHGHTVILGLGMGWLTANVALQPQVERVTVVERDADIIALVAANKVFERLPEAARRKITVVQADALDWHPDRPVDSLQADIWLKTLEDGKLADIRRMQANIAARSLYFWGQEMEIWRHACRRLDALATALDWPVLRSVVTEEIGLPLVLPDWADYPQKIVAGAPWCTPKNDGWWR